MPGHCRYASAMHGQMTGAVAYPRPADKGAHFPKEIMLTDVRWYVAYPLSQVGNSKTIFLYPSRSGFLEQTLALNPRNMLPAIAISAALGEK